MRAKEFFLDSDEPASGVQLRSLGESDPSLAETRRDLRVARDFRTSVPRLAIRARDLTNLPLDPRVGFLLSRIDGLSTVETIIDLCPMPAEETLAMLESLRELRIITG
ncbi:MAG TPA: hypothetical protein VGI39_04325 [Polyangiaceae bacterium]|jgi:hypothetical protein